MLSGDDPINRPRRGPDARQYDARDKADEEADLATWLRSTNAHHRSYSTNAERRAKFYEFRRSPICPNSGLPTFLLHPIVGRPFTGISLDSEHPSYGDDGKYDQSKHNINTTHLVALCTNIRQYHDQHYAELDNSYKRFYIALVDYVHKMLNNPAAVLDAAIERRQDFIRDMRLKGDDVGLTVDNPLVIANAKQDSHPHPPTAAQINKARNRLAPHKHVPSFVRTRVEAHKKADAKHRSDWGPTVTNKEFADKLLEHSLTCSTSTHPLNILPQPTVATRASMDRKDNRQNHSYSNMVPVAQFLQISGAKQPPMSLPTFLHLALLQRFPHIPIDGAIRNFIVDWHERELGAKSCVLCEQNYDLHYD